jgi:hypothetical protein
MSLSSTLGSQVLCWLCNIVKTPLLRYIQGRMLQVRNIKSYSYSKDGRSNLEVLT